MEFLIGIGVTLFLLFLGVIAGGLAERRHFRELTQREVEVQNIVQTQTRVFLEPIQNASPPTLLTAETVVATDYFKRFVAAFRNFFGGEVKSFNTLVERARRETTCRILEQAKQQGYNAVCNLRLEPADVGGNLSKKGNSMVCVVGSATAYHTSVQMVPVVKHAPIQP